MRAAALTHGQVPVERRLATEVTNAYSRLAKFARGRYVVRSNGTRIAMQYYNLMGIALGRAGKVARTTFALVVTFALCFSAFHGLSSEGSHESAQIAALRTASPAPSSSQQAPAQGDHCLQHLQTFGCQELPTPAALVNVGYTTADAIVRHGLSGGSPFEPPRA
jgi:hypothetical protein